MAKNIKIRLAGDPILSVVCDPVEPGEDVSHIIKDMMRLLVNSKSGVGISAPQAGCAKRMIIVRDRENGTFLTMINPEILKASYYQESQYEGCLSYPGIQKKIQRPTIVLISYHEHSKMRVCSSQGYRGMTARIIQHEIDHLNGECKVGVK